MDSWPTRREMQAGERTFKRMRRLFSLAPFNPQRLAESTVGGLDLFLAGLGLHVWRLAVGVKIQHIRRDAEHLRKLVDYEILGRVAVIMLDSVEVGRIDNPSVLTPQPSRDFSLREAGLLASLS